MANPIIVGTIAIIAIPRNVKRVKVRFQNTGASILYFYRNPNIPSSTNYEFLLEPAVLSDVNDAYIETNSTAQFNVVSSAVGGELAIFETARV